MHFDRRVSLFLNAYATLGIIILYLDKAANYFHILTIHCKKATSLKAH